MSRDDAEQFLRACGGDQPIRFSVGLTGDAAWESWVFNQPCLLIGRRADSDLVLDHWQISRRHAYIQYLDGGFICVDLGSRTGTYGGPATERAGWIPRNHAIRIGPYEVRPTWPDRRPDREPGNQLGVTWELPRKAAGGAMWRMDRPLVLVGHSPACRVRIVAGDVSNFHCSLVRTQYGVWAVDLLGTGGMQVNGMPARIARLDDGDELQVGRHVLRPRYDEPPPRIGPAGSELILVEPAGLDPLGPNDPFPPRTEPDGADHLPARLDPFAGKPNLIRPRVAPPALAPFSISVPAIEGPAGTVIEPVVTSLVQQFGAMQQQMFDQFHQTMMAMFEGFAAMHREQSDAMRAEMDEVRRLSKEIADLQAETERIAEAARVREAQAAEAAKQAARNPAFRPPAPRPASPSGPGPVPIAGPAGTTIPSAFTAPTGPPLPPPAGGDDDIHALLVRKLASMHNERQGRWQKILGMMGSKP